MPKQFGSGFYESWKLMDKAIAAFGSFIHNIYQRLQKYSYQKYLSQKSKV